MDMLYIGSGLLLIGLSRLLVKLLEKV